VVLQEFCDVHFKSSRKRQIFDHNGPSRERWAGPQLVSTRPRYDWLLQVLFAADYNPTPERLLACDLVNMEEGYVQHMNS